MMIRFHCPAEGCGKRLTVTDQAAGRSAKCPKCGASLVVPMATPEPVSEPQPELTSTPEPVPVAVEMPVAAMTIPAPAPAAQTAEDSTFWEADETELSGPPGRAISYGAIGIAWRLLREQFGTWVLTTFVVYLLLAGLGFILQILTTVGMIAAVRLLGPPGFLMVVATMVVVNLGIQGIVYGGLFRMALKQVDGGTVAVGDFFSLGGADRVERLIKAGIFIYILAMIGCALLVIPGLVFFGLSVFTIPLIVDSRMGTWASLRSSVGALRRDWFSAMLFVLAMTVLMFSGVLLLGLGVLFTMPWGLLAIAVQYRRSFAPGAKPRQRILDDPHAEAIGTPEDEREAPRAPVLAWGLMGGAILIPAAAAALLLTTLAKVWESSMDGRPGQVANPFAPSAPPAPPAPRVMTKGAPAASPRTGAPAAPRVAGPRPAPVPARPGSYGPAEAFAGLRGDSKARLDAIRWLSSFGPAPDEPLRSKISKALEPNLVLHPNEANLTAHALDKWATLDNLPAVAAASWYENSPDVSTIAKKTLDRLRQEAGPDGQKTIDDAVEHGREAARLDDIRMALAEARSDDDRTRLRAVQRLRKMTVEPRLQDEVVSTMAELIQDRGSTSRTDAVGTIGTWARPGDEKILIAFLAGDDDDPFARPTAVEALARSKDPEAIATIVALASDRSVASYAARAIHKYGALAEPALMDRLRNDTPQGKVTACRFLDDIGTQRCLPALKEAANDPDRTVAATARRALKTLERRLGIRRGKAEKRKKTESF